jgi:tight adherence protein B
VNEISVLGGVCGAAVAAGLLLVVVGLRPVPIDQRRRPDWSAARSRARALVARRRTVFAAVVAGVVVWAVTGWPVAALAAATAVVGLPRLVSGSATRAQLARLEALEAWTRRLADLLGSGAGGLEQAIAMSVRTCPAPIAKEVTALAGRIRLQGAEPALRAFADDLADIGSPAADLAAAALILRVRRGGRGLRPVLEALAADVAELVRARRAVEADRAKPRSNVRVLVAITAVVLTVTLLFARDYLTPFTTPLGQVMLAAIVGVFAAAVVLLARITRQPTTPRFLPPVTARAGLDSPLRSESWWT